MHAESFNILQSQLGMVNGAAVPEPTTSAPTKLPEVALITAQHTPTSNMFVLFVKFIRFDHFNQWPAIHSELNWCCKYCTMPRCISGTIAYAFAIKYAQTSGLIVPLSYHTFRNHTTHFLIKSDLFLNHKETHTEYFVPGHCFKQVWFWADVSPECSTSAAAWH